MAQRILFKDSGLGNSNNPLSGYKFVGYNGLTFSQLDSDGNIVAISGSGSGNTFTSISITGGASAGYVLTSDSSGNAYWTASVGGPGGVGGTGTTDYLPKWTGSSTLGDSIIRENGTNVSIGTAPSSLQYVKISDSRNISDWYKEGLTVESSSATFSRGIYVSMSNTRTGTGIYVQYKSKATNDLGTSIASIMSGPGDSHNNHANTITGGALTSPVGSSNTNIVNWIHNDYKRTSYQLVNIYNTNNGEGNGLYGITTIMAGTAISVYGENIQINSTATDKIRGVSSIVSGSSSASSTGVYIETTHPFDNSKSYGIVVNSGKSVFNDGQNSYSDFQIKGETNGGLFYADVSADNIGIGTTNPDTQAILDLSSTTKGFLPPRMTADQANAAFGTQSTAPEGMLIYITATSSDPAVDTCFFDVGWYGRQDAPGPGYPGSSVGFNWVKLGYYSYG